MSTDEQANPTPATPEDEAAAEVGGVPPEHARLRLVNLRRDMDEDEAVLWTRAADRLGVSRDALSSLTLLKRSLDARRRPQFIYQIEVSLAPEDLPKRLPRDTEIAAARGSLLERRYRPRLDEHVVVIGAGPAGLFCAHRLALDGARVTVLDRGEPVEVRGRHVSRLMHHGELREDSNICFGEGGAGTWSDGKLYTRVNDIRVRHILETIVALGGPERILVDAKPHLGTDKLVALCKAFRAELTRMDCTVRFGSFVRDLDVVDGQIRAVILRDGERVEADRVVMAVGHSARELYHVLADRDVQMERKPFAVGFRVEHPQAQINSIQYGRWAGSEGLPTADYRLAANFGKGEDHRGVYSFCMCPGGQVVPSATLPDGVCVNGMSHASRRGKWANSALVVSIKPEEFGSFGEVEGIGRWGGLLDGMAFQEEAERRAYREGGGGFIAPAQRLTDFRAGRLSTTVRKTTYKPGVAPGDLSACYPEVIIDSLRRALDRFNRTMPGFLTDDAVLIGVETRTSAPVRVLRDDRLQSCSVTGLYPCGEGAGYGGGIVSAALDGLRVAEQILAEQEEGVAVDA